MGSHNALPRKGRFGRSKFPDGMEDFIRAVAPGRSSSEIADMVNVRYGPGTISAERNPFLRPASIAPPASASPHQGIAPQRTSRGIATFGPAVKLSQNRRGTAASRSPAVTPAFRPADPVRPSAAPAAPARAVSRHVSRP